LFLKFISFIPIEENHLNKFFPAVQAKGFLISPSLIPGAWPIKMILDFTGLPTIGIPDIFSHFLHFRIFF